MYRMDFVLFFFLGSTRENLPLRTHAQGLRLAFGLVFREMAISGAARQKRSQKG
jgi:hypothetical protein